MVVSLSTQIQNLNGKTRMHVIQACLSGPSLFPFFFIFCSDSFSIPRKNVLILLSSVKLVFPLEKKFSQKYLIEVFGKFMRKKRNGRFGLGKKARRFRSSN